MVVKGRRATRQAWLGAAGRLLPLLVLLVATGCEGPPRPATGLATSASATAKARPTGLSINGDPVAVKRTFTIGTKGETATRWVLSTSEQSGATLSCETLREHYPERPPATVSALDFVLMRPIDARGAYGRWSFSSAHITDGLGARGLAALGGMVEAVHAAPPQVTAAGLELALHDRRGPRELLYSGDLTASDCGRVVLDVPARPQSKLAVKVGEKALTIAGASMRLEAGKQHLRLTVAPHGCNSVFTNGYDIVVDLVLHGEPTKLVLASLSGECMPGSPSASVKDDSASLKLAGALAGQGPIKLDIDAKLSLHGYPLEVVGSIDALRCLPTPPKTPAPSPQK